MDTLQVFLKNGAPAVIRRARPGDEYGYAAVSNSCYTETRFLSRCAQDDFPTPEDLLGFVKEVEHSDKEILLVAECDGRIVAFGNITACLDRAKMRHKCDLAISILARYWGLGLGKAMMLELIGFARQAGYEQVSLNVADDNRRAIGLYEHLGFVATGREVRAMKHGDGDYSDFVFMTKFLKEE